MGSPLPLSITSRMIFAGVATMLNARRLAAGMAMDVGESLPARCETAQAQTFCDKPGQSSGRCLFARIVRPLRLPKPSMNHRIAGSEPRLLQAAAGGAGRTWCESRGWRRPPAASAFRELRKDLGLGFAKHAAQIIHVHHQAGEMLCGAVGVKARGRLGGAPHPARAIRLADMTL